MPADIATALTTAGGATILATITYGLTKKREREADLRKERLAHYKDFVASLSGIVMGEDTPDGQRAFARACNNLNLVAPQAAIQALQAFQDEIRASNPQPKPGATRSIAVSPSLRDQERPWGLAQGQPRL